LQIKNDDSIAKGKTFINYIYAEVKWDWPVPPKEPVMSEPEQIEYQLVPIR
jgi:hypothetical protein